jgi:hypothetical protein
MSHGLGKACRVSFRRGSKPGYTRNAKGPLPEEGGLPTNARGWQTPSGGTRTLIQRTYDLKKGGVCQLWVCGPPLLRLPFLAARSAWVTVDECCSARWYGGPMRDGVGVCSPFSHDWLRRRSRMCGTEAKHSMPAAQVVIWVHLREEKCFARGVFFLAKWQNTVRYLFPGNR